MEMKKCPSCGKDVLSVAAVCRCGNVFYTDKNEMLTFYMLTEEEMKAFAGKPLPDAAELKTDIPQYNIGSKVPFVEKDISSAIRNGQIISYFKTGEADNGSPSMSELYEKVRAVTEKADNFSLGQNTSVIQRTEEEKQFKKKVFRQCRLGVIILLVIQTVIAIALFFLYDSFEGAGASFKVFYIVMWVFYLLSPAFYQVPVPDSLDNISSEKIGRINEICSYVGAAVGIGTWVVLAWNLTVSVHLSIILMVVLIVLLCLGIFQALNILKALSPQKLK